MNTRNRNILISLGCCVLILLYVFSSFSQISSAEDVKSEPEETVIKIPPPIDGLTLQEHSRKPQTLEKDSLSILSSEGKRYDYVVELAKTPSQQKIGMMFRHEVPEGTGMLFLFPESKERSFWMKNTFVPLDLIFIRKDGVIHHIHPMAEEKSLTPILSNGPVSAVLEIAGGESQLLNLNIGDRVLYTDFMPENTQ